jgi:hypothetical protein
VEIVTNILSEEQFRQELRDAVSLVAQRGITNVTVSFGFTGAAPELEDAGVGYTIPIADVLLFIAERERTKGFRFGLDDCWITPLALDARFLFCNDRDVHVTSHSIELLDSIRARWRAKGFNVYPDDIKKEA